MLAQIDRWATRVKADTERHLYRLHDPRYAAHYHHSEAYFRAEMLIQVLQEEFGVHYNQRRVDEVDFTKSKGLFLHGLIGDANGGTCVSMPVAYVAVGRRLGYPLKLVTAPMHVLCRWDGEDHANPRWRERFNIEATSSGGMDSHPDQHYLDWPVKTTAEQARHEGHLVSMSPAEELALFLANRGHCLQDNGRLDEAQLAYGAACRYDPARPAYRGWLDALERRLHAPVVATRRVEWWRDPKLIEAKRQEAMMISQQNARLQAKPIFAPIKPTETRP